MSARQPPLELHELPRCGKPSLLFVGRLVAESKPAPTGARLWAVTRLYETAGGNVIGYVETSETAGGRRVDGAAFSEIPELVQWLTGQRDRMPWHSESALLQAAALHPGFRDCWREFVA